MKRNTSRLYKDTYVPPSQRVPTVLASAAVPRQHRPIDENDELAIAIALSKAEISDKPQRPPEHPHRSSDAGSEALANCAVCLSALEPREANGIQCGHAFHRSCIMRWLVREKKECPICRATASAHDVVELY